MLTWILGFIGLVLVIGVFALLTKKPAAFGGARFPPGTRAFESEMSLKILAQMIAAREVELAGDVDPAQREMLETEVANMRKQAALHHAIVDAGDVSPGKGSFGVNPSSDRID